MFPIQDVKHLTVKQSICHDVFDFAAEHYLIDSTMDYRKFLKKYASSLLVIRRKTKRGSKERIYRAYWMVDSTTEKKLAESPRFTAYAFSCFEHPRSAIDKQALKRLTTVWKQRRVKWLLGGTYGLALTGLGAWQLHEKIHKAQKNRQNPQALLERFRKNNLEIKHLSEKVNHSRFENPNTNKPNKQIDNAQKSNQGAEVSHKSILNKDHKPKTESKNLTEEVDYPLVEKEPQKTIKVYRCCLKRQNGTDGYLMSDIYEKCLDINFPTAHVSCLFRWIFPTRHDDYCTYKNDNRRGDLQGYVDNIIDKIDICEPKPNTEIILGWELWGEQGQSSTKTLVFRKIHGEANYHKLDKLNNLNLNSLDLKPVFLYKDKATLTNLTRPYVKCTDPNDHCAKNIADELNKLEIDSDKHNEVNVPEIYFTEALPKAGKTPNMQSELHQVEQEPLQELRDKKDAKMVPVYEIRISRRYQKQWLKDEEISDEMKSLFGWKWRKPKSSEKSKGASTEQINTVKDIVKDIVKNIISADEDLRVVWHLEDQSQNHNKPVFYFVGDYVAEVNDLDEGGKHFKKQDNIELKIDDKSWLFPMLVPFCKLNIFPDTIFKARPGSEGKYKALVNNLNTINKESWDLSFHSFPIELMQRSFKTVLYMVPVYEIRGQLKFYQEQWPVDKEISDVMESLFGWKLTKTNFSVHYSGTIT